MQSEFAEVCRVMRLNDAERQVAQQLQASDCEGSLGDLAVLGANEETAESFERISCCVSRHRLACLQAAIGRFSHLSEEQKGALARMAKEAGLRKEQVFLQQNAPLYRSQLQELDAVKAKDPELFQRLSGEHSQKYCLFRVTAGDARRQQEILEKESHRWRMKAVFAKARQIMRLDSREDKLASQLQGREYRLFFDDLADKCLGSDEGQAFFRICCCVNLFRVQEFQENIVQSTRFTDYQKKVLSRRVKEAISRKKAVFTHNGRFYQQLIDQVKELGYLLYKDKKVFEKLNLSHNQNYLHFRVTAMDVEKQKESLYESMSFLSRVKRTFKDLKYLIFKQDGNENQS